MTNLDSEVLGRGHCSPDTSVAWNAGDRKATGLYPEVSREKMAAALGIDKGTVSNIFRGRTQVDAARAMKMAGLMRVELVEFVGTLERRQKEFRRVAVSRKSRGGEAGQAVKRDKR